MDDSLILHLTEHKLITTMTSRDPWKRLSAYESSDLVRRLLKKRHHREPRAEKSIEVAANVTQGRQYFEAAANADVLTRPLLLYYGVLSLSRAIILCADVNLREAALETSHGLSCVGWGSRLAKGAEGVERLELKVTNGTFSTLSRSTRNVERSLIYVNQYLRYPLIQPGTEGFTTDDAPITFALGEVLARLPDLADLYMLTFDELGASHPTYVQEYPGFQRDYYILSSNGLLPTVDRVRNVFDLSPKLEVREQDGHFWLGEIPGIDFNINRNVSPPEMRDIALPVKNDSYQFTYIVEPFPNRMVLSHLSLLYLVSFAMGMLVRYHPSHWANLSGTRRGDYIRPLLGTAAELVERRFPALVIEEIEQSHSGSAIHRRWPT